jgi:hypothetical protein
MISSWDGEIVENYSGRAALSSRKAKPQLFSHSASEDI